MSDITHSDYCPEGNTGEREECVVCTEIYERAKAYYYNQWKAEQHYTPEEIADAYSDPTERAKRDFLLGRTAELRSLRECEIDREK